jgi:hypothetical protein
MFRCERLGETPWRSWGLPGAARSDQFEYLRRRGAVGSYPPPHAKSPNFRRGRGYQLREFYLARDAMIYLLSNSGIAPIGVGSTTSPTAEVTRV